MRMVINLNRLATRGVVFNLLEQNMGTQHRARRPKVLKLTECRGLCKSHEKRGRCQVTEVILTEPVTLRLSKYL